MLEKTDRLDHILGVCQYFLLCAVLAFNGFMLWALLNLLIVVFLIG